MVYYGQLNDDIQDIPDFLSKTYGAITRFNPRLLEKGEGSPQLDLIGDFSPQSEYLRTVKYFHSPGTEDELKTITHWIVVDVANKVILLFLENVLKAQHRLFYRPAFFLWEEPCMSSEAFYSLVLSIVSLMYSSSKTKASHNSVYLLLYKAYLSNDFLRLIGQIQSLKNQRLSTFLLIFKP